MSYKCTICGKGPSAGNSVSHSKRHTRRLFRPNLQKIHMIIKGEKVFKYACTKCIRSGFAKKALVKTPA